MLRLFMFAAVLGFAFAQRDNPRHSLAGSAFDGVTELPEGDIIEITSTPDNCLRTSPPHAPEISFKLTSGLISVRRWKAATLHRVDNNSNQKKVVQQQCGFDLGCSTETRFNYTDILDYGSVVLWKDELWPLQPYAAYRISNTTDFFKPGMQYTINWIDDGWIPGWVPTSIRPGLSAEAIEEDDQAPEAGLYQLYADDEFGDY